MRLIDNKYYEEDIAYIAALNLPWDELRDSCILISGGCGLIGSCIIDVIMEHNLNKNLNCRVYALGRNESKARKRFDYCWDTQFFRFIPHDINLPLNLCDFGEKGYVIHMASNTHPVAYATDPIGTVTTNIIGTKNMLDFACSHNAKRLLFASSNEVYGENRGDEEFFNEEYCGYINSNTLRAGYPESKRCGEALCQAYKSQKDLDIVIPRLTRSYGPTMLMSDTKAISQFIRKGIAGENIILKSAGTQYYSYTYVVDAVSGLLTVLLKGKNGEAYNIAYKDGDIMLKDLAALIAEFAGTKVVFEIPDALEASGYSTATKARLNGEKLSNLGWKAKYNINAGIHRTVSILKQLGEEG